MSAPRRAVVETVVAALLDVLAEPAYELTVAELVSAVYSLALLVIKGVVKQHPAAAAALGRELYPLIAACAEPPETVH